MSSKGLNWGQDICTECQCQHTPTVCYAHGSSASQLGPLWSVLGFCPSFLTPCGLLFLPQKYLTGLHHLLPYSIGLRLFASLALPLQVAS